MGSDYRSLMINAHHGLHPIGIFPCLLTFRPELLPKEWEVHVLSSCHNHSVLLATISHCILINQHSGLSIRLLWVEQVEIDLPRPDVPWRNEDTELLNAKQRTRAVHSYLWGRLSSTDQVPLPHYPMSRTDSVSNLRTSDSTSTDASVKKGIIHHGVLKNKRGLRDRLENPGCFTTKNYKGMSAMNPNPSGEWEECKRSLFTWGAYKWVWKLCVITEPNRQGFKSQFCHLLVVWPWASYRTSSKHLFLYL